MSPSHHQSRALIDYTGVIITADVYPSSIALAFVTKMSEKCKSASPSAIQVKK